MKSKFKMVVLCLIFFGLLPVFAENTELRVTLNVNAYDRMVVVKVNGQEIKKITGGHAQAIQLYHKNHSLLKGAPKGFKELFCLKEGKNTIEISHSTPKGKEPMTLEILIKAIGYSVPLLKYIQKSNIKGGQTSCAFELHSKQPKKFKTVILEIEYPRKPSPIPSDNKLRTR